MTWDLLKDLLVTLVGTFAGVFGAFWLERRRREAEARRHYANTLNAIRAYLANLWATSQRTVEQLGQSGRPHPLFPPDTPALEAALASSSFYDRVPYGLVTCLIVLSNVRRSIHATFTNNLAPRDNEALKTWVETLLRVLSHVQEVLDEEAKPLGKPVVRTTIDAKIIDGLNNAIRGECAAKKEDP